MTKSREVCRLCAVLVSLWWATSVTAFQASSKGNTRRTTIITTQQPAPLVLEPLSMVSDLAVQPKTKNLWDLFETATATTLPSLDSLVVPKTQPAPTTVLSVTSQTTPDYLERRQEWIDKYTTVEGLRRTLGGNRNWMWGDLDAFTTRCLYKTLLPKALIELQYVVAAEELAPLAYQARKAAKMYARERCQVPARLAAYALDGIRQLWHYGKWNPQGMSYEQLWEKYRRQVQQGNVQYDDDEIGTAISMKILERSCHTNEYVDDFVLKRKRLTRKQLAARKELGAIRRKLESDVQVLLNPSRPQPSVLTLNRFKTLKMFVKFKRQYVSKEEERLAQPAAFVLAPTRISVLAATQKQRADRV